LGSSVGANGITQTQNVQVNFSDQQTLDEAQVSFVRNSLEITNEEPITSVNSDITLEELKQRAMASYASQNRAVTKQDYESLVYNMPNKFGAIKRANIVNDPSSTNRRLSMYVISENSDGNLATTNSVIKNNLKNWLSSYKMLNDVVDIIDAKIINFSVDFSAQIDKRFDSDSVLFECVENLKEYFAEISYIGEPIYITRIYQRINDVDGVIDVKNVKLENLQGGQYSPVRLNFDNALSRDGTYIKIPHNTIAELKFPEIDIKGTVK
jgi:phage-related baseplate assembly protein